MNMMQKNKDLPGKIDFHKLFEKMEEKKIKKIDLRKLKKNPIHPLTIQRLVKGEAVSTDTIIILCDLLDCNPGDIMEYVKNKKAENQPQ